MAKDIAEIEYQEDATIKFLRAESFYKEFQNNPNKSCYLENLSNEAVENDNPWAIVRYIEIYFQGIIGDEQIVFKNPKKRLKKLAKGGFYFAQLKWAQYVLLDSESSKKNLKRAIWLLKQLLKAKIYCADAYYYLGIFYSKTENCEKTKKYLNKSSRCGNKFATSMLESIEESKKVVS